MSAITHKEFKIKSREENFRVASITPVDMLAISTQVDFENLKMTKELYKFAFENAEVEIAGKWLPVKTKNEEVYWPNGIENDFVALNEIFTFMMKEVITKVFQKSSK